MAPCFGFTSLPAKLRLSIWDMVLRQEADCRLVILYDLRVMPLKHLVSPLLSVNTESRHHALRFYTVRLNVYALAPPTLWLDSRVDPNEASCDEMEAAVKESILNAENNANGEIVRRKEGRSDGEMSGICRKALYVSPDHDMFVTWIDCLSYFFNTSNHTSGDSEDFETSEDSEAAPPRHFISGVLVPAVCQAIKKLVCVEQLDMGLDFDMDIGEEVVPYYYEKHEAVSRWRATTFTGIQFHGHLWLNEEDYCAFVDNAANAGLATPAARYDIRRWKWRKRKNGKSRPLVLFDPEGQRERRAMERIQRDEEKAELEEYRYIYENEPWNHRDLPEWALNRFMLYGTGRR